nr:glycoside hydrolase family 3 C-terminal domain-containing protein [Calditrichia bacterium]
PERMLRDIFLPPFKKAVEAGVGTVMVNSGDINGIPSHSDHYLLTRILREELGFDGLVVSDWADINNLYTRDKVAASRREAVKMAVLAGIDMSMVPFDIGFYDELLALVKAGEVPIARIDEAVARILRVKFRANLFEKPYPDPKLKKMVGTPESAATSLEAARQAMTLLKNEGNLLPLDQDSDILLCGPTADLLMVFNGGWSYTWQGNMEGLYPEQKMTLLEAMQDKLGPGRVTYLPGTSYDQAIDIAAAAEAAQGKDVAVIALGEYPYCETPGNINDLTLPAVQLDLVKAVQATGTPVVLVLLQGRPRIITPVVAESEAILMAYLPGNEGGKAIVEVLFGETNPGGRLPVTYPAYPNALTNYDAKWVETDDPNKMSVMWPFGHGLSYTTFAYSGLTVQRKNLSLNPEVEVRVTVTNTGQRAGREIVHLYLSDVVRSVSPQVKQLRGFESLFLKPGESRTVSFTLTQPDFLFHDRHNQPVVEAGQFVLSVGNLESGFELSE